MLSQHENMKKPEALRRMNQRCKATFFDNRTAHFSNINNTEPVWWFHIPLKKVEGPRSEECLHLICYDRRSYKLRHLTVLTSYFRVNLRKPSKLLIIDTDIKKVIQLELSIHNARLFQDRWSGCRFGQFECCEVACEHS
jgi:hypothetical protein